MTWVEVSPVIVVDVVISCCPSREREVRCACSGVLMPGSEAESWTLLGDDQVPLEPVERFLAYLASVEKSPNTVKAYAHDLKDWLTYLTGRRLDWQTVTLEDVAGFVAWLQLPPEGRDGKAAVLPAVAHHCSAASVNRKLAALVSFCEFHARHGVALAVLLVTMQPAGRRGSAASFKPFLHHITKGEPQRRRTIKLKASRPRPKVLTATEVQTILDACNHLRDRLLFALLLDCGVRIGEVLGLRHEDMGIAERTVTVMPRPNDNGARAKAGISRTIPASAELMRLYADYLTREYGPLDSDYVFVNLWSQPYGRPWAYAAVYDRCFACGNGQGSTSSPISIATPMRPVTKWAELHPKHYSAFSVNARYLQRSTRSTEQARSNDDLRTIVELGCHHPLASGLTMMQPVRLHRTPA